MSKKLHPAAFTSTSRVPGRSCGSGASRTASSAGSTKWSTTIARIGPYASSGAQRGDRLLVRNRLTLLLAVCTALASACATLPRPPVETGQLFLWDVERGDGTGGIAHVLGSIHISEQELSFDPAVDRDFADADTLAL